MEKMKHWKPHLKRIAELESENEKLCEELEYYKTER